MRQRLFRILWALPLLLCLATAALWVRSYWRSDGYAWSESSQVYTERGELVFAIAGPEFGFHVTPGFGSGDVQDPDDFWNPRRKADHTWNALLAHGEEFPGLHMVVVRFWGVCVVTAIPLAPVLARYARHHRRAARGCCTKCGYDLRATNERCPECGTSFAGR